MAGTVFDAASDEDQLGQDATRQEQIRGESQLLINRLDAVLDEYASNGLDSGDDFNTLKQVRDTLGSLSDGEMEQVVTLLRQVDGDPTKIASAYLDQKDVSLKLREILNAHERQQDLDALARAVRQLADRQSANLTTAIDARQLAAQDQSANGKAAVTASLQAQQSEQQSIAAEVKMLSDKLGSLIAGPTYADAATALARVPPEATEASDELGAGKIDDAVTAEQGIRQELEDVARQLAPAGEQPSNSDAGPLADIVHQQRDLLTRTAQLSGALKRVTDAESQQATDAEMYAQIQAPTNNLAQALAPLGITRASPPDQIRNALPMKNYLAARMAVLKRQEAQLLPQLTALSAAQAALAAKADMVREDLQNSTPAAVAPMADAQTQMSAASQSLASGDGNQATKQEMDAATALGQAQRLAGQPAPGQPEPLAARSDLLQAAINALTARESQAVQQGDAEKTGPMAVPAAELQQDLAARAQALEQAAADQTSPGAQALQQAADALQSAAQAMQAGSMGPQAEAAQQAALQSLKQAADQFAQQATGAQVERQEMATLGSRMANVARLIQAQRQLGLDADKAGAAPDLPKARQLAARQAGIGKATQNLRQALNTGMPDAAKALDNADNAMGDAAQKMAAQSLDQARPPRESALSALYQAQDAMAGRMGELSRDLGQPSAPARAGVAAAIAKAQAQAEGARAAMAPGAGGEAVKQAAGQLAQAGHLADAAASQPQILSQDARDAVRAAAQALAEAASSAASGDGQQAQQSASQAIQALSAAQSAMGQSDAGVAGLASAAPATGSGSGQSQSQEKMGSKTSSGTTQGGAGASEKTWNDKAGTAQTGSQGATGAEQFQGLPERDRAAFEQSQSEKYPQEYGSMVEEYMRSLASDSGSK
jgi:hypothetical protein